MARLVADAIKMRPQKVVSVQEPTQRCFPGTKVGVGPRGEKFLNLFNQRVCWDHPLPTMVFVANEPPASTMHGALRRGTFLGSAAPNTRTHQAGGMRHPGLATHTRNPRAEGWWQVQETPLGSWSSAPLAGGTKHLSSSTTQPHKYPK